MTQLPRGLYGLYWSATTITPDGSDTNAYGEACEPGRGYTEQSGWWDPDGDFWRVHERDRRDDVRPDVYPHPGYGPGLGGRSPAGSVRPGTAPVASRPPGRAPGRR
jgi:hypothetical protein